MAKKDVEQYYEEVNKQYKEMLDELKDFEAEAEKGLFPPEKLDQIKQSIQPLMRNYEVLSYIMFLLNKPTRKQKAERYNKQNKKLLSTIKVEYTKKGIIEQNNRVIERLNK